MPLTVRRPDVMYLRKERVPANWALESYRAVPDLVVEVISPNDLAPELEAKVAGYLDAGVRIVWVVDPEQRIVRIHRADGSIGWLRENDALSGDDVLPGFTCPVRELFPVTSTQT